MTKEEIKNTPEFVDFMLDDCVLADSRAKVRKRLEEICDIAIKALEQEPCEDTISREQAIRATYGFERYTGIDEAPYEYAESILRDLPSVTPQPKAGYWIIKDGKEQGYDIGGVKTWYIQIKCSKCGFISTAIEGYIGQYNYCPNCGEAKMIEPMVRYDYPFYESEGKE